MPTRFVELDFSDTVSLGLERPGNRRKSSGVVANSGVWGAEELSPELWLSVDVGVDDPVVYVKEGGDISLRSLLPVRQKSKLRVWGDAESGRAGLLHDERTRLLAGRHETFGTGEGEGEEAERDRR